MKADRALGTIRGRPRRLAHGWSTFSVEHCGARYEVQALAFDAPSQYGIDGGKVSKLWIRADGARSPVYSYDRGLDFDRAPAGLLALVLGRLP
jgi:hypothetical protein